MASLSGRPLRLTLLMARIRSPMWIAPVLGECIGVSVRYSGTSRTSLANSEQVRERVSVSLGWVRNATKAGRLGPRMWPQGKITGVLGQIRGWKIQGERPELRRAR